MKINQKESTKAWSTFEVKSVDEDKRIIKGIASTITPDRDDDIMRPDGAKFTLPFPFLLQHNHDKPIGHVIEAKTNKSQIEVTIQIVKDSGLNYIDTAWKQIKAKLINGLSIGFRGIKVVDIDGTRWGREFIEWDLYELSAVTVPANSEATITSIKKFDTISTDGQLTNNHSRIADAKKQVAVATAKINISLNK